MFKRFRKDMAKYKAYSGKSAWVLLVTQQGLWALFVYRWANAIYRSQLPGPLKKIGLGLSVLFQKMIEILTGITLPYATQIGEGFYIGHYGGIILNAQTVIGDNCNISQGVTIGVSGTGTRRGVPVIGNNVYIGANAVVVGKITIGDNVVIGANSLVTRNVEAHSTVVGVPAQKVSDNDSTSYI